MSSIDHPRHYTAHPSGVECIDIVESLPFNFGNAIKYAWRAGLKGARKEDLAKCAWYCEREATRIECGASKKLDPDVAKIRRVLLKEEGSFSPLRLLLKLSLLSESNPLSLRVIAQRAREAVEELKHEEALKRADAVAGQVAP